MSSLKEIITKNQADLYIFAVRTCLECIFIFLFTAKVAHLRELPFADPPRQP